MAIYTVHQPPRRADRPAVDPERFVFVRDGFSFWAFLLTPLWMLWHRLWLVLVLYLVIGVALQAGLGFIGASASVMFAVGALLSLLIGFEAATLRRFGLARRGWNNIGIVVGDDIETAERRFYDAWASGDWAGGAKPDGNWAPGGPIGGHAAAALVGGPTFASAAASPDVIGLFPEPGARR